MDGGRTTTRLLVVIRKSESTFELRKERVQSVAHAKGLNSKVDKASKPKKGGLLCADNVHQSWTIARLVRP